MSQAIANRESFANVSRETFSLLSNYVDLLLKWNAKINLIGPTTENDIWKRHIEDSLQLIALIPAKARSLVDLGSGAGLPGMVIAIHRPDLTITLVEQDQRKAAFLNEARRLLRLSHVTIEATDMYQLRGQFDVVTARALAPLSQLMDVSCRLMKADAMGIFPKGKAYETELAEGQKNWRFHYRLTPSKTSDDSSIITISELFKINP